MNAERQRLAEARSRAAHWKRWGPYLSERAWGTVREDYSTNGTAWDYLPHDHARSKAYRWNEDGIAGISDRHQLICFALALWNRRDPILKERLFGLTGSEGNHGEDVKEYYFYLDSTPTHSYMKYLYKYPQQEYPYARLVEENRRRGRQDPEFELLSTGVFDENRYFDVFVEYAKADVEDILIRITVANRGPELASLDLLPTIWFRNTWAWNKNEPRPFMRAPAGPTAGPTAGGHEHVIQLNHPRYGERWLYLEGTPQLLFTENETNYRRLHGVGSTSPYVKDGIHDAIVEHNAAAVNPSNIGTKAAAHYPLTLGPGESVRVNLRLTSTDAERKRGSAQPQEMAAAGGRPFGKSFDRIFAERIREADEFYAGIIPEDLSDDARNVMRQALAGMLWSKQYYHYEVAPWLDGDPDFPPPPPERRKARNHEWRHLFNADVISMPDKWEYPWYAAWDLAFHCIPLALVDPDFAKEQLILLLREWYMHPNGQIPAYEWAFGDVNPPVHAWAAWRVYKIEKKRRGRGDRKFLKRVFHKLMLNFTWWVNRKDAEGKNVFQGGFLGLDNIGVFDRSAPLPTGGYIEQADGTSWMGMFCLNMLTLSLELACHNNVYEDIATKFLSPYGIRALSRIHADHPYVLDAGGARYTVDYQPAESNSGLFGGNSNWRGPIWMPVNYLLIESLQQFHHYYGDDFKVECPTGSGQFMHLKEVANELSNRLIKIWTRDENGECAFARGSWRDGLRAVRTASEDETELVPPAEDRQRYLFHEYFHGDVGAGLGASHQTGWTALVAKLIQQQGEFGTIAK